ncbi:hypothetical protein [Marinobacter sp. ELB17]|uniref:hypothetical protein n=1 Tax=Marinobacter sp. ELB17 TaxID=270374 RepID=UPI0000F3B391|nr:hypothetical protein [Marinobacter sp. ELB17]EAZ98357.1 hypothetical protein MELB17_09028 [Marinobacter sp. ELB17]
MAIILDSIVSITRVPVSGKITDIRWLTKNISEFGTETSVEPEHVVYLLESFGEGEDSAPQSLSFELGGDEFALYMSGTDELAREVYDYLKVKKHVTISSVVHKAGDANQFERFSWTVPVTVYKNYVAMVSDMAAMTNLSATKKA